MDEIFEPQKQSFAKTWFEKRLAEFPTSDALRAIVSALAKDALDESKLLKTLESLTEAQRRDNSQ
jgi:hypothetical protein